MGYRSEKRPQMLTDLARDRIAPSQYCHAKNGAAVSSEEFVHRDRRIRFTFDDLVITMTDADTNGNHGAHKFADFNEGLVAIVGAISNLSITAAAGIDADAAVVGSVGSTVAGVDNATLTTTEANIIPSTACTLTSSAGVMDGEFSAIAVLDGTQTAVDAFLNFAVPGDDASANSTITVSGYIDLIVRYLGDNN